MSGSGRALSLRHALFTSASFLLLLPTLSLRLPQAPPFLSWLVLLVLFATLTLGQWWRQRRIRDFLVEHHVLRNSRWFPWLRGGILLWPGAALRGAALALALLAGLLAGGVQWWWMVVAPLLLHALRRMIHWAFASALQPAALYLWSERVGGRLALFLLTAFHVIAALYLPQPDLGGVPFAEAASRVLGESTARSGLVALLQIVGEFPFFLYQWSVQQVIADGAPYWWVVTGWLAILVQGAVVYWPVLALSLAVEHSAGPVAAGRTP